MADEKWKEYPVAKCNFQYYPCYERIRHERESASFFPPFSGKDHGGILEKPTESEPSHHGVGGL
jgi:hypothetical protein